MSISVNSDPFLEQLASKSPKEAREYFNFISESKFKDDLAVWLETPAEILSQIGVKACRHPNFPEKELEKIIQNQEILESSFWDVFASPNLSKKQIAQLMKNPNPNVKGLALAHEYGDQKELLGFLKESISSELRSIYVVGFICGSSALDEETFQYLLSVHQVSTTSSTIGKQLWTNQLLTPEQRATLALYEVEQAEQSDNYWGNVTHKFHPSSLAFFKYFNCSDYWDRSKIESLSKVPEKYVQMFSELGHPLGLLLTDEPKVLPEINPKALSEMISEYNLLHRLFWTELCERPDFEIYRRNAYRTDDLFISHPILGAEFDEASPEEATQLGGVFIFSDNFSWLVGEEELSLDMAVQEMKSSGETLEEVVSNTDFDSLGMRLVAFALEDPELADRYGFQLTEEAENWVIDEATTFAESDYFDVTANLNPNFDEKLSWRKLPEKNKRAIFDLLKLGSSLPHSKATADSIHFLGCMALHEATPESILKELGDLSIPLVDAVLDSRSKG